jgi:segregation and condensation protein A
MLHLDGFDGPMDLLLDLAERQVVDLDKMSIVALAEQFAAALETLGSLVPIEQRADWVVLAARLVLLRARLLYPANPEAAANAEREADVELRWIRELAVSGRATTQPAAKGRHPQSPACSCTGMPRRDVRRS